MTDPVGTVGASEKKVVVHSDLHLAFEGGAKYHDRIKELSDAKDAAQATLDNLAVGRNAHAAFAQAKATAADADKLMDEARVTLEKAKEEASAILARAHDAANSLVERASADANTLRGEAAKIREEAQAEADRLLGGARQTLDSAQKKQSEADALHSDLLNRIDRHEAEHSSLMTAASEAKKVAEELASKLSAQQEKLKSLLGV